MEKTTRTRVNQLDDSFPRKSRNLRPILRHKSCSKKSIELVELGKIEMKQEFNDNRSIKLKIIETLNEAKTIMPRSTGA